jgi:hypothetical protein
VSAEALPADVREPAHINCPLCRRPLHAVGQITAGQDYAGQYFSFPVCWDCALRLGRLPKNVQFKQLQIAVNRLADDPQRFGVMYHADKWAAKLYVALESERIGDINAEIFLKK